MRSLVRTTKMLFYCLRSTALRSGTGWLIKAGSASADADEVAEHLVRRHRDERIVFRNEDRLAALRQSSAPSFTQAGALASLNRPALETTSGRQYQMHSSNAGCRLQGIYCGRAQFSKAVLLGYFSATST